MQITNNLTIAVHTLLAVAYFGNDYKVTSKFVAASANVNAVVVRRIFGRLQAAGILGVKRGSGGAYLKGAAENVTLLTVYRAIGEGNGEMFNWHTRPNPACPVGSKIHAVLDDKLTAAQSAFESELDKITIARLLAEI